MTKTRIKDQENSNGNSSYNSGGNLRDEKGGEDHEGKI